MGKYYINKGNGEFATLFTRIRKRKPHMDFPVNTQIQVHRATWDKANSSATALAKFFKTKDGAIIQDKMNGIDEAINNLFAQGIYDKEKIMLAVGGVVYSEERERAQRELEEQQRKRELEEQQRKRDVRFFLSDFIRGIKSGDIKFHGNSYGRNTCKVWESFEKILRYFYSLHPFTWCSINQTLVDSFVSYMEDAGYMVKSINKNLTCFRAMVGYAYKLQYHDNSLADRCFSKKKVLDTDKAKEIYLSTEEIQALYEMPLIGTPAIVRDVFLVGCYTCQRFSDYSKLNKSNFTTTPKGTKVVKILQVKTKNSVVIPVLNNNLLRIAERYDYQIPTISDVVLNRYIKQILKELSVSVPSLAQYEVTRLTMKERDKEKAENAKWLRNDSGEVIKPRYELVSSHTARRSGITNLYLSGKFDMFQMMSISGHKDQKTFLEYIKLSSDELADKIAQKADEYGTPTNAALF